MTDTANGQVQPDDTTDDLNVIVATCRALINDLDTMKLVKVTAVNPGSGSPPIAGTVTVQLLVSQIDAKGFPTQHGTVSGIPYFRLGGTIWQVVVDPAVGDIGYVVCADRDSSLVVKNGGIQNPGSRRRYNVADGIYVGGIQNGAPKASVWLKSDGTFAITDQNNNSIASTSTELNFGISGATVLSLTASLASFSVNVKAPDFVTPTLTSIGSHTHHVSTAPGESNPPTSGT